MRDYRLVNVGNVRFRVGTVISEQSFSPGQYMAYEIPGTGSRVSCFTTFGNGVASKSSPSNRKPAKK